MSQLKCGCADDTSDRLSIEANLGLASVMLYCPHCGNLLLVDTRSVRARNPQHTPTRTPRARPHSSPARLAHVSLPRLPTQGPEFRFYCQTCPYLQPLKDDQVVAKKLPLSRKKVDDVLGGDAAWANVDQTDAVCPDTCGSTRAYFMQIQIRSADEPMTIFYKCVGCKKRWSS